MKQKFEYFHNHGDDEGNNSLTICFGDSNEPDNIIVGCEDTEEDAIEAVKRLNAILDQHAAQCVQEFKDKMKNELMLLRIGNPLTDIGHAHNSTIEQIIHIHL